MTQGSLFEMFNVVMAAAKRSDAEALAEAPSSPRQAALRPAVSPIANLPLREACAHCEREVGTGGCIILDFEELSAFCGQECADWRFRLYLEERPGEDMVDMGW